MLFGFIFNVGLLVEYVDLIMFELFVVRINVIFLWFINCFVVLIEGILIYWIIFLGVFVFIVVFNIIFVVCFDDFCVFGWNVKIIGFFVLIVIIVLKIVVDVGFVVGVIL